MITFIDDNRSTHGVEPICKVLPIAPSTYHKHVAQRRDPLRLSARAQRDMALKPEVARVFAENFAVYGVRKVWRQMQREGFGIARCTVERLMRDMGLAGVIRGKPVRTTFSDKAAPCRWITSTGSFMHQHPTSCGCQILPMSQPGPDLFMWPS
jgi:putative transposase